MNTSNNFTEALNMNEVAETTEAAMDALMMDVLDGTITPADQVRLDAYLATHPDERAQFEQLVQFDGAFERAGQVQPILVPVNFVGNVMSQIQTMPAHAIRFQQPALKTSVITELSGRQIALIILLCSTAMAAVLALGGGALAFGSSYLQPQPAGALLREIGLVARDIFGVFVALLRGVFMLPLTWVVLAIGGLAVAMWTRVVASAWAPRTELA